MSIGDEEKDLVKWLLKHQPPNTTKVYNTYSKQYLLFCVVKGYDKESSVAVASFMRASYDRGLRGRSTLTSSIPSAIADMFRYEGFNPCDSALVKQMKRVLTNLSNPPVSKLPLEVHHLEAISELVRPNFLEVRDFFIILLMMAGMLRENEAMSLRKIDVWIEVINKVPCLFVFVAKAKNDQSRIGHSIVIGPSPNRKICPVRWYRAYMNLRSPGRPALFHRFDSSLRHLSSVQPNFVIKRLLKEIGVDPTKFGSHSCRRGGVTAAVAQGIEIRLIARHGNWKSDAIFTYISDSLQSRLSVSRAILKNRHPHRDPRRHHHISR